MGRNNKQRRAAKRRKQRRQAGKHAHHGRDPGGGVGDGSRHDGGGAGGHAGQRPRTGLPPPDPRQLLHAAVQQWGTNDAGFEGVLAALAARGAKAVSALELELADAVDALWGRGWTPADLVQVTSRQLSAGHVELAAASAVADGHARTRRGQRLHPRWEAQLADLAERDGVSEAGSPLDTERLRLGVELLCLIVRLEEVPVTMAAPGADSSAVTSPAGLDGRVLGWVRALLAKAESTPFDEEAEALTAKAQELIARHAVDEALLHADDDVGLPSVRRIPVDPPYADAKALLLSVVAGANRCRLVYSADFGWVTVFGYDADLDAVELLAASLMAQATAAMARQGSRRDATGRSRTRSFRRSFLLGYAGRVGERLCATADAQVAAADAARLLPVLAARQDRLDAAVDAVFPELDRRAGSISHAGGYVAGRAAAELARLDLTAGALHDTDAR